MARRRYRYKRRQDDLGLNSKRATAFLLCVVAAGLLFVAVVDLGWTNLALRVLAGAGFVGVVLLLYLRRDRPDFTATSLGKPDPASPTTADIRDAENYVLRHYDAESVNSFIQLLLDGPRFLSRVHEEVEYLGRTLCVKTSLQFRIDISGDESDRIHPAASGQVADQGVPTDAVEDPADEEAPDTATSVLVPIVLARKGHLFDGFRVTGAGGTALPTLTQWETRGLTALAVEALFRLAKRESGGPGAITVLSREDQEIMWEVITSAVCQVAGNLRGTPAGRPRDTASDDGRREADGKARDAALNRIAALRPGMSTYWVEKIAAMCQVFAESYVVVAEVPLQPYSQNLVLRYSSYYAPERMHLSAYEQLRSRCGLSPTTVDVPMTRALHADSYHFEVVAPPGCYVFSHHLEKLGSREPLKQSRVVVGGKPQYARLYHDDGRSIAHLYIRHQGTRPDIVKDHVLELDRPDLKSVVRFREVPPGALANAALLALVSTVVIAFFGLSRVGIDSPVGAASLPALILALPAFIASAVGRGMDQERIGRAPLTAYFGLYSVITLSLLSTLLYIFEVSKSLAGLQRAQQAAGQRAQGYLAIPGQIHLTVFGDWFDVHTDVFWILIFAASAVLSAYLMREKRNAMGYYLDITERRALEANGEPERAERRSAGVS